MNGGASAHVKQFLEQSLSHLPKFMMENAEKLIVEVEKRKALNAEKNKVGRLKSAYVRATRLRQLFTRPVRGEGNRSTN